MVSFHNSINMSRKSCKQSLHVRVAHCANLTKVKMRMTLDTMCWLRSLLFKQPKQVFTHHAALENITVRQNSPAHLLSFYIFLSFCMEFKTKNLTLTRKIRYFWKQGERVVCSRRERGVGVLWWKTVENNLGDWCSLIVNIAFIEA